MKRILLFCMATLIILTSCSESNSPSSSDEINLSSSSSEVSSSAQQETKKPVGIKGSHIIDLTLGLEQTGGIPKPELKASKDKSISSHYCSSKMVEDTLGVTFDYNLSADVDFALISGTFGATSDLLLDEATFVEVAKSFLGFCSTIPCDALSGDMSRTARVWLEYQIDNIHDIEPGASIVFDDAKFSIVWSKYNNQINSIWLNISQFSDELEESEFSLPDTPGSMYRYAHKP